MWRFLLYPFALLYGIAIGIRNKLFDWGLIKSVAFPLPVISVGNIAVGGSGKTPLVEYLIRLLKDEHKTATLSRGYKRKTKGYLRISAEDTVERAGDEPLQYARKYSGITVAVDESRRHGIRTLMAEVPEVEAVILDDAFQHRYVKPGLSILVTDYHRIYTSDYLMPVGRLREPARASKRADIIVVTKTPRIFSPLVRRQLLQDLKPASHQLVCFSYISYENWLPVYPDGQFTDEIGGKFISIIMLTGIANPAPLEEYLRPFCSDLTRMEFPDHHEFTEKDFMLIRDTFLSLPTKRKAILTTEKDAMRLRNENAVASLRDLPLYYVPIRFHFHPADKESFDSAVGILMKRKNRE